MFLFCKGQLLNNRSTATGLRASPYGLRIVLQTGVKLRHFIYHSRHKIIRGNKSDRGIYMYQLERKTRCTHRYRALYWFCYDIWLIKHDYFYKFYSTSCVPKILLRNKTYDFDKENITKSDNTRNFCSNQEICLINRLQKVLIFLLSTSPPPPPPPLLLTHVIINFKIKYKRIVSLLKRFSFILRIHINQVSEKMFLLCFIRIQ